MLQSVGFRNSDGIFRNSMRSIYYLVHGDQAPSAEDEKTLFQSLKTTQELILSCSSRKVGVPAMEIAFGAMTIRMLEYLFSDTGVQIGIFQSQREIANHYPAKENKTESKKDIIKARKNVISGPGRHRGDALLIQMEGMNSRNLEAR